MARKRGGLAGFYDRNKGFLKKAVPVGLSFIPGVGIPLAAAAGAAMGADTEGKGYFSGFNVGGAVKGGIQGYGIGRGTQALAGGARSLLAPSGSNPSVLAKQIGMTPSAGGMPAGIGTPTMAAAPNIGGVSNLSSYVGATPSAMTGPASVTNVASGVANAARNVPSLMGAGKTALIDAGKTAAETADRMSFAKSLLAPQVLGSAIQGGLSMLPSAQSEALNAQTRLAQQQFDEEKRRTQMEEERKRKIAELLMPFMQKNFPQYLSGGR